MSVKSGVWIRMDVKSALLIDRGFGDLRTGSVLTYSTDSEVEINDETNEVSSRIPLKIIIYE